MGWRIFPVSCIKKFWRISTRRPQPQYTPLAEAHRRGADIQREGAVREDQAEPELRREHHRDGADLAEDHPRRHQGGLPENPDAGDAQEEAPRPLERAGGDAPRRELAPRREEHKAAGRRSLAALFECKICFMPQFFEGFGCLSAGEVVAGVAARRKPTVL